MFYMLLRKRSTANPAFPSHPMPLPRTWRGVCLGPGGTSKGCTLLAAPGRGPREAHAASRVSRAPPLCRYCSFSGTDRSKSDTHLSATRTSNTSAHTWTYESKSSLPRLMHIIYHSSPQRVPTKVPFHGIPRVVSELDDMPRAV
jgi:hypothetical protein